MILKDWLLKEKIPPYKFAKQIQIAPSTLYRNLSGERRMTPKHAVIVERLTCGQVSRTEAVWPEDFKETVSTRAEQMRFTAKIGDDTCNQ